MLDIPNEVFSAFSFIAFVVVLIPFPWHLQAWNTGTCLYMAWTALQCLNSSINSILWNNNIVNWAPVFCDISTKLSIGANIGVPAASLCINRRLYIISQVRVVSTSRSEKRLSVYIDLAIGLGLPMLIMALSYIVQGHRFNINEDIGCGAALYNTALTFPLVYCWPLLLSCISAVYCVLSIRVFAKQTAKFREMLSSTSTTLSLNRYFRLMALASTEIILGIPLSCFLLYLNIVLNPIQPWRGWADTHFQFSAVDLVPKSHWSLNPAAAVSIEIVRWLPVVCAFIFFGFFGFALEAKRNYAILFWAIAKRFGYKPKMKASNGYGLGGSKDIQVHIAVARNGTIPSFVSPGRRAQPGRKSIDTMSEKLDTVIIGGGFEPLATDTSIQSFCQTQATSDVPTEELDSPSVYSSDSHYPSAPPGITLQSPPRAAQVEETRHPSISHLKSSTAPVFHWPADRVLDISAIPRHHPDTPASVGRSPRFGSLDAV
ncbi:hypothetical protein JAAARDRAFT_185818 [Jaapia argillacea MUCL 33604]|uniref:Uncharacterized protein n=1 Tax=Jaapia argillacea MUCL 33604 TaxID=933084 RepID=A0A067P7M7_9AGAM|nr:hypothetical protein JAAARDRAFT_185818 [Jaapia argillacea MUCL 33604]